MIEPEETEEAEAVRGEFVSLVDQLVILAAVFVAHTYPTLADDLRGLDIVANERDARVVERTGWRIQDAAVRDRLHNSVVDMIGGWLARLGELAYSGHPITAATVDEVRGAIEELTAEIVRSGRGAPSEVCAPTNLRAQYVPPLSKEVW